MRIRNRKVPLPISWLCPVPILPDPSVTPPSLVQLNLDKGKPQSLSVFADTVSMFNLKNPSDQTSQPIGGGSSCCSSVKEDKVLMKNDGSSNDSGKKDDTGTEKEYTASSSDQGAGESLLDDGKAFPLKKRRGNPENRPCHEAITLNEKKLKSPMEVISEEGETLSDNLKVNAKGSRKRGRGGALVEGSRCSRVNGRGWRCCQQTLVGYSLCEHHLGKGRLRSMRNVGSRTKPSMGSKSDAPNRADRSGHDHCEPLLLRINAGSEANQREDKPSIIPKKKKKMMKLGIVKARSISSLLGITSEVVSLEDGKH